MEFPKLLIADGNDEFRESVAQSLRKSYQVRTCRSGSEALELLQSFRPDILMTDLMLPDLDGLTLLEMAAQAGIHPKVLVAAYHFSPYAMDVLRRLDVDYCMRKPCSLQAVMCRLNDFAASSGAAVSVENGPEEQVAAMLVQLGIGPHLDGFRYLCKAIPLFGRDTGQAITKELYVAVGELFNKDARQVERSIRSAIEGAWKRRSDAQWSRFFTPGPGGCVPKLSNGKFIAHLSHLLTAQSGQNSA